MSMRRSTRFAFVALGAALSLSLVSLPTWAGSLATVSGMAGKLLVDLGAEEIALDVVSARDARQDPAIQALLAGAPLSFEPASVATAVYYRGRCTLIVNTAATDGALRPELARLTTKSDVLAFVTTHEVGHCIAQHRQAAELKQLAAGQLVADPFLPPQVLEQGQQGTLTRASFAAILKSASTARREEAFADALAALYARVTHPQGAALVEAMRLQRRQAAEEGDEVHDTVAVLTAALQHDAPLTLATVVQASHGLRQGAQASARK